MHFFLTTGPWSGYSAIGGAGLSSYRLSLIVETMSIECKRNRHYKTIKRSQKKKKKKKKKEIPKKLRLIDNGGECTVSNTFHFI